MTAEKKAESDIVQLEYMDDKTIALLRLNRPLRRNALNSDSIRILQQALEMLQASKKLRALILLGNGADFCAGADLEWMKASILQSREENVADAKTLAFLLQTLQRFVVPTIAIAHGAVFGGGLGIIACCDFVLASAEVKFCFSEVKLGLVPAIIAPFVSQVMPIREMQRYCLTAETFGAEQAWRCGLVHEVYAEAALLGEAIAVARLIRENGPIAVTETKALLHRLRQTDKAPQSTIVADMVQKIAEIRVSPEAQEGMTAFFEKRKPAWGMLEDV
jgi:methylglutaconyl-CoA hydratase